MAGKECGKGAWAAAGDFWGTEALFHEGEGGFAEGREGASGGKEAREELVDQGVNTVGGGCLLAYQGAATAGELTDFKVDIGEGAGGSFVEAGAE